MMKHRHLPQPTLHVIMGPMFAGKSTEMLRQIRRYGVSGLSSVVIKWAEDVRIGEMHEFMRTHGDEEHPCVRMPDLTDLSPTMPYDVIGIDDGQFFDHQDADGSYALLRACHTLVETHRKIVIVSGLSSDWRRRPFANMCLLAGTAETVQVLTAVCEECGRDAPYTRRTTARGDDGRAFLVGGKESYAACCRKCHRS